MAAAVTRDPELSIPISGETVAATRYEPTDRTGPLPAILWSTPYHKDDQTTYGHYDPLLEHLAVHGYEVVVADLLGTGASTGEFVELLAPETGVETAAVVEWLADRPWTTGRVGMIGKSAAGFVCLATAAENPDPLEAIVPIMCPFGRRQGPYAPSGIMRLNSLLRWMTLYVATAVQPPSRRDRNDWLAEIWRDRLDRFREADRPMHGVPDVFDRDRSDDYWEWTVSVGDIAVPTFAVGGYRDTFSVETLTYFGDIDAPKRLLMGPWRHVIPHRGREAAIDFRRQTVDWFDGYLKHADPPEAPEPTITFWTERHGGRSFDDGIWRGMDAWPTVDGERQVVRFSVTPGGLDRGRPGGGPVLSRTYEFDHTVGMTSNEVGDEYQDTGPDDARSLSFETDALRTPVEWTGTGRASIRLTSTSPEAAVCVRIVDVGPNGRTRLATRGATRLGNGSGDIEIEPDVPRTVPVDLRPTSHVFERDHRIRLAIGAADFPRLFPAGDHGAFSVTSSPDAPTSIAFPGRQGPMLEFEDEVSMNPPNETLPVTPTVVTTRDAAWETCREHVRGRATVKRTSSVEVALPHVDKGIERVTEIAVDRNDPTSLDARSRLEFTLNYDEEQVTVGATAHFTGDERWLSTVVALDGEPEIERKWER